MMVDDRGGADDWGDWGDWGDWEDERTSPLRFEEQTPHRDNRSLIQRLAASPDIQIVWRAARAPAAPAQPCLPR
jgi:hypothetical protein